MRRKVVFTPEFEEAMRYYPARHPDNPRRTAFMAWNARLEEGISPAVLIACVKNYAEHCRHTGKEGTYFVLQAQTFFGPNDRYVPYIPKPKTEPQAKPRNAVNSPVGALEDRIDGRQFIRDILNNLSRSKSIPI